MTSVVGRSRSSTRVLTETSISPQAPRDSWKRVRSRVFPSLPTTWPTRFSSCAMCWLAATISLNVSAIFPANPTHEPGSRTEKSPSRMVCRLAKITLRSRDASVCFGFPIAFRECGRKILGTVRCGLIGCGSFHGLSRTKEQINLRDSIRRYLSIEWFVSEPARALTVQSATEGKTAKRRSAEKPCPKRSPSRSAFPTRIPNMVD